jgi:hypothetical protein
LKASAGQVPGRFRDHDRIRCRKRLEPRSEIERLTDGDALMRRAFADQLTNHYGSGGDSDAKLWEAGR